MTENNENDNEVIGPDWITISMSDGRVIGIKPGVRETNIPVFLGEGDIANYLVISAFSENGYQGGPQVGIFASKCKYNRDIKPGDIIDDVDIDTITDTDVAIIIKSKQVLADLVTDLNKALDKWVGYDDEREEERYCNRESEGEPFSAT